jgi:hypothetical protein
MSRRVSGRQNRRNPPFAQIGTALANRVTSGLDQEDNPMFDRHFLTSKLGIAALVSVAMMVAFNVYAMSLQLDAPMAASHAGAAAVGLPLVVLA